MRFGLFIPQGWRLDLVGIPPKQQWATMRRLAREADAGPWDSLWVYDHLQTAPIPTEEPTYEAWTLTTAFAASTERIRLGQMCTCLPYRNPALLAKMAATADHVSAGRLDVGVGAGGWFEHEWRGYGYGFPSASERLAMLDEGVQILRQAWAGGVATLHGRHYRVDGAICRPLPFQDGGIPLWVAGGGERRTLRIAACYGQYTNFDPTPDVWRHKSAVLAEHCRELGRDFDSITRSASYFVVIAETERGVRDKLDWIVRHYEPMLSADALEQYRRNFENGPLVGTPDSIVERLIAANADGMTYALCNFVDSAYDVTSRDLFATQVIPALA